MGFFGDLLTTPGFGSAQPPGQLPEQPNAGEYLLMQQRAAVELQRTMVKLGRADAAELENAERRLKELEGMGSASVASCGMPPTPLSHLGVRRVDSAVLTTPAAKMPPLRDVAPLEKEGSSDNTMLLRAELMSQIDKLGRKRAEACNAMHDVPKEQDCPELMASALAIHQELENVWTSYRYLERNGKLPEEETETAKEVSLELLMKLDERKRYAEKRSKLKKKLADPYNHKNKKRDEWQDDLDLTILEIGRLNDEIYLLKNR